MRKNKLHDLIGQPLTEEMIDAIKNQGYGNAYNNCLTELRNQIWYQIHGSSHGKTTGEQALKSFRNWVRKKQQELNSGLKKESNEWIKEHYPIQDETWPSRRWNADRTEYQDMSG